MKQTYFALTETLRIFFKKPTMNFKKIVYGFVQISSFEKINAVQKKCAILIKLPLKIPILSIDSYERL